MEKSIVNTMVNSIVNSIVNSTKSLIFTFMLLAAGHGFAAERIFKSDIKSDLTSGVKFSIGYSAGVHKGNASHINGNLVLDENDNLLSAHFEVPIDALTTGNATRDCHMREALGIEYAASQFPNEHVCDSDNRTPSEGPDAITHNLIVFDFSGFEKAPVTPFAEGVATDSQVKAVIQIHGKSKNLLALPIKIQKTTDALGKVSFRVTAKMALSLKDFAVVVKPFKFGPISIGVDDKATADLDLLITEAK